MQHKCRFYFKIKLQCYVNDQAYENSDYIMYINFL